MTGRYPRAPVPAVLAVVPVDGRVVLVRRANPPRAGTWGMPGGKIDLGETLFQAAERELAEETGLKATAVMALPPLETLDRDVAGAVRYHYLLVPVLCRLDPESPPPVAASDADAADWFDLAAIAGLPPEALAGPVSRVARLGMSLAQRLWGGESPLDPDYTDTFVPADGTA